VANVPLPPLQIVVTLGGSVIRFNGTGSASGADEIRWESEVPGGHVSASFRIPTAFYAANSGTLRYGARVEINVAPGAPSAGQSVFTGYLLSVVRPPSPDITLEAVGFQQLVRERSDPLLWQSAHAGDWLSTNSDPFGTNFACSSSIQESAAKGHLDWTITQGQQIDVGDQSNLAWYFGQDVNVTRLAGTLNKKADPPGTSANPNYRLRHKRYDGPTQFSTGALVNEIGLYNGVKEQAFTSVPSIVRPVTTLELTRSGGASTTGNAWRVWINDIRVNGDAYQQGRSIDDTYPASNPILDMAFLLGFSTGKVTAGGGNCLPLWHQSGPWSDVFDHLSKFLTGAQGWKWGIWDWVSGKPEVEFRDYTTGNTTWTTNAYGTSATAVANITASQQDLYSKVVVTYRHGGSGRLLRAVSPISPNPFAGLDPPISSRQRIYHYHLRDPQRPNSTLPATVAAALAADFGTEQHDGTIDLSYANDGGGDKSAVLIRAGHRITISDFPGGARTFRVKEVSGTEKGPIRVTVGRRSRHIARLIWNHTQRERHRGTHHIAV
jgi:hypothetical protein